MNQWGKEARLPIEIWGKIVYYSAGSLESLFILSKLSRSTFRYCWQSLSFKSSIIVRLVHKCDTKFLKYFQLPDAVELTRFMLHRNMLKPEMSDFVGAAFSFNQTDVVIEFLNAGWPFQIFPDMVAKKGNLKLLKILEERQISRIISTSVLDNACEGGHLEVVKFLMEERNVTSISAIHHAARGGHVHVIDYLSNITNGRDINLPNFMEITPL
jgi:hypothetical protein